MACLLAVSESKETNRNKQKQTERFCTRTLQTSSKPLEKLLHCMCWCHTHLLSSGKGAKANFLGAVLGPQTLRLSSTVRTCAAMTVSITAAVIRTVTNQTHDGGARTSRFTHAVCLTGFPPADVLCVQVKHLFRDPNCSR